METIQRPCQLIVDPPASGSWNMAVDEALLEHVGQTGCAVLRLYRWERPTLSLGYFQSYADRQSHPASLAAPVVRRQSGGGAILHDQEITYSFIAPTSHPWASDTRLLYDTFHKALILWLYNIAGNQLGDGQVTLCDQATAEAADQKAFLCFKRRSIGDVLLSDHIEVLGHKLIGSAQRRRRSAVLQHGSILWNGSPFAPEIGGFAQLLKLQSNLEEASAHLVESLGTLLPLEFDRSKLTPAALMFARSVEESRYAQTAWTERR